MSTTTRINNPTGGGYFDLGAMVNKTADRFETLFSPAKVSRAARNLLVVAMLPHVEQLKTDLLEGRVSYEFLEETLFGVLSAALQLKANVETPAGGPMLLKDPNYIDDTAVQTAMKKECRLLGWC
jgi:hypothetical protein